MTANGWDAGGPGSECDGPPPASAAAQEARLEGHRA